MRNLLVLAAAVCVVVSACGQPQGVGPGAQANADVTMVADCSGGGDVVASIDALDDGSETAAADGAVDGAVPDAGDVFDPANVPKDVTWSALAAPSVCVPAGTTVVVMGAVGPPPALCLPYSCDACGPTDKCTCDGDGNTGCAWRKIAPLPFPLDSASHVWGDGKLYIWGGSNNWQDYASKDPFKEWGHPQTVEIWDPVTDTWSVTTHAPVLSMDSAMGVAFGGGKLYVAGSNPAFYKYPGTPTSFVDLPWGPTYADHASYDPVTQTWTPLPQKGTPGACGYMGSMAFAGGRLIVAGCDTTSLAAFPDANVGPAAAFDAEVNAWLPLPELSLKPGKYYPWQPEVVVEDDAAGWIRDDAGRPTAFAVLDTDAWMWTIAAVPPKSCINVANQGAFALTSDGTTVLAFRSGDKAAFVWNKATAVWKALPVPAWLATQDELTPVWTGHSLVFGSPGHQPWPGAYDLLTGTWRQLPKGGELSYRYGGVATAWAGRALYIGGNAGGAAAAPLTTGAGILVP